MFIRLTHIDDETGSETKYLFNTTRITYIIQGENFSNVFYGDKEDDYVSVKESVDVILDKVIGAVP